MPEHAANDPYQKFERSKGLLNNLSVSSKADREALKKHTMVKLSSHNVPVLPLQTTTNMSSNTNGMLQPQIFESLQQKIDEDTSIRDVSSAPVL